MNPQAPTFRTALKAVALAATALAMAPVVAQPGPPAAAAPGPSEAEHPELFKLKPIPNFTPPKTAWGDPDLRGGWPIDSLASVPLQRTPQQGKRIYLTEEELAQREKQTERAQNAAERETKANKLGMGNWVESFAVGGRTSLLIEPADGRLPALTAYGDALNRIGRSSWVNGQTFDWTTDYDNWDRCITRGFPGSMLPFRYNNGMRIFQAPGIVVIDLEMIHDSRIVYLDGRAPPPKSVTNYMGFSRGHWEGNTLVVETTNIRKGASPLNMATIGAPPNNTVPMSDQAKVVERFTLADANTLVYDMTYSDPAVFTAPFTTRMEIPRNDDYQFFEYACHEGDVQVRNYITSSRALRAQGIVVDQGDGPVRE
ncbi:MAG TPA: hypothetical protein VFF89_08815 [Sphingobium sp.]|nr:hypothetical protein [Sphingobium sp.]